MSPEPEGVGVLQEVVGILEARGVDYWLGRGRFRHFTLTQEFGNAESDIDFHVLREDEAELRGALADLAARGYVVTSDAKHKVSLVKNNVAIEFMYLEEGDPHTLVHETVYPYRKLFSCPAEVFGSRRLEMFGVSVRVPELHYLPCVFGPEWKDNKKGAGGELIKQEPSKSPDLE